MQTFQFTRATTPDQAIQAHAGATARYVAGGTNLVDMMKLDVEQPTSLIDINELSLSAITPTPTGGLHIGAL